MRKDDRDEERVKNLHFFAGVHSFSAETNESPPRFILNRRMHAGIYSFRREERGGLVGHRDGSGREMVRGRTNGGSRARRVRGYEAEAALDRGERGGFVFLAFFPSIRRSPRFNIPDNGYKSTFRPFNLPYIHRTIHPSTSLHPRPLPHQPHPKAYIWTGWREFRPFFPTLLLDGTCHIGFVTFVSSLQCITLSLLYLRSYRQLRLLGWDGNIMS